MNPNPNKETPEQESLRKKVIEIIDGWRFEQEWVSKKAKEFPEHKGAGCGCSVCQKMAGLNAQAADGLMQLFATHYKAREADKFEYSIGQNIYLVYHEDGIIVRHKVTNIQVTYYENSKTINYYDGRFEIPKPTAETNFFRKAVSVFLDRKSANKAAIPFKKASAKRQVDIVKREIDKLNDRLTELSKESS